MKEIITKTKTREVATTALGMLAFMVFFGPHVYYVANLFGVSLAPDWYQRGVEFLANGGTIVGFCAVIAGVTLPAWVAGAIAGFGLASA